jgi:hypothetical protein
MKKQLLEEINRMKVLGGMINEAASPSSILAQLVSKFTKTALDDSILAAFEVLERKGVIGIDKISKTLTKVDWQKLADDEMKLLFTAPPLRAALEEVTKKAGVDITSSAQKLAFKGGFKKIVKGYDDAAGSLISGGGSKGSGSLPSAGSLPGAGSVPNFNIPNLNTTALNQAWKVDVASTRAALKAQFPKASSRDIEIMVQGLSKTKDQATFDIAIKEAVENFKPTYAANLSKPGKRELIRKNWNLLPSWAKTAIGLSATVVGYRAIKGMGIPIDKWLGWLIGGAKEVGGDQYNSAKDELKKGFKKSNDANSSGINPAKDSIIVQPNNTEDPLGILQNKGGGN